MATGTSMRSRSTCTVRVSDPPGVKISSSTFVPAGPLMRPVARALLRPAIERPLTDRIRSCLRMPACFAGEPSKTFSTRSPRLSFSTLMPTPSKWPETDSWKAFASVGVR